MSDIERGPEPASPIPWVHRVDDDNEICDADGRSAFGDAQYYPWVSPDDFPAIVHRMNHWTALFDEVEHLRLDAWDRDTFLKAAAVAWDESRKKLIGKPETWS